MEKSNFGPERSAVVLGIGIDLERRTFNISPGKKTKINRGIKELLEANRRGSGVGAGAQVSARLLAKTVGRIMALHVVCGNVVRRLTRRVRPDRQGDGHATRQSVAFNESSVG